MANAVDQPQFAGTCDRWMTAEDLFGQGGAGPGHPDNEDGCASRIADSAVGFKKFRREESNRVVRDLLQRWLLGRFRSSRLGQHGIC